ncbi:MAG: ATP-binding protein, partial [Lentisphaeria bacterium]
GPRITASASQMRQLLLLLLTNAWEARDGNRRHTVRLSVQAVPGPATPGGTRHFPPDWQPQPGPYACLEVADTGCGIPPEALDKLFDPFYSTKSTGRGLGLSMALGIVRTHDGAIEVTSEPGRGSVFRIYLPAHPNP